MSNPSLPSTVGNIAKDGNAVLGAAFTGSFQAGKVSEDGHIAGPEGPEIGNINAGHTKSLTVNLPPGTYTIMCNLPGHYVAGMHATIVVK